MHASSPAYHSLTEAYEAAETVTITVTSVTYDGGSSWRVEWDERVNARETGEVLSEEHYIAVLVLGPQASVGREELEINPLGLMVENIDIQKVRTDSG